jgi:hypothetical protein
MADEDAAATAEDTTEGAATAPKPRSKHGVPRVGLETIDGYAQKIWEAARLGDALPVTVARALTGDNKSPASGGAYKTRIATLRRFGIIETLKNGNFKLTSLGIAMAKVGDPEGHAAALVSAMRSVPAYLQILERYDGGELSAVAIATHFEFEYAMSGIDATSTTELFIGSARYARLIDEEGNVSLGAPSPASPSVEDTEIVDESDLDTDIVSEEDVLREHEAEFEPPADDASLTSSGALKFTPPLETPRTPTQLASIASSPVALNLKLDMSAWAVDDVLRVLAALGYEGAPGESD